MSKLGAAEVSMTVYRNKQPETAIKKPGYQPRDQFARTRQTADKIDTFSSGHAQENRTTFSCILTTIPLISLRRSHVHLLAVSVISTPINIIDN